VVNTALGDDQWATRVSLASSLQSFLVAKLLLWVDREYSSAFVGWDFLEGDVAHLVSSAHTSSDITPSGDLNGWVVSGRGFQADRCGFGSKVEGSVNSEDGNIVLNGSCVVVFVSDNFNDPVDTSWWLGVSDDWSRGSVEEFTWIGQGIIVATNDNVVSLGDDDVLVGQACRGQSNGQQSKPIRS